MDITIKNFKGIFERASDFDLPDVIADTCQDFLPTYDGKLVKRKGYATATLNSETFTTDASTTTSIRGNILNMFELVTGRPSSSAPNAEKKYVLQTDHGVGHLYLWKDNNTHWIEIDGGLTDFRDASGTVQPCRFLNDSGSLRVLAGNRSVNVPLWWGWSGERWTHAVSAVDGTKTARSGAFPSAAVAMNLSKPAMSDYVSSFLAVTNDSWWTGIWDDYTDDYYYKYRIAIQYNNREWTPPSDISSSYQVQVDDADRTRVRITFRLSATCDQRITGIRLFRGRYDVVQGYQSDEDAVYYMITEFYLNDDFGSFSSPESQVSPIYGGDSITGNLTTATKTFKITEAGSGSVFSDDQPHDDLYNGCFMIAERSGSYFYLYVTDVVYNAHDDIDVVVNDVTGMTNGVDYELKIVEGWYLVSGYYYYTFIDNMNQEAAMLQPTMFDVLGITGESYTSVNPKYGTMVEGQAFYGNAYHLNETKEAIAPYGMLNNDGLFSNGIFRIINVFSPGFPIKGVSAIGDRLIYYGDYSIARGIRPEANESSWDFERLFEQYGLLAEWSLINIHGKDYFLATDWSIKRFDGITTPVTISDGIYDVLHDAGDSSISYLTGAVSFFIPKLNMYGIKIQTGTSTYEYWLYDLRGQVGWVQAAWHTGTITTDVNFVRFFNGKDGSSWAFTSDECFLLQSGTTDDGVSINPDYKTLPLSLDKKMRNHLSQMVLLYKSNTEVEANLYLDGSGTAVSQVDASVEAKSATGITAVNLPLGTNGRYFQLRINLASAVLATNTSLEIDEAQFPIVLSGGDE